MRLPIYYATFNGDLFNLPAGPVSFALGGEYYGERWTRSPDSLNSTFQTIGSVDSEGSRVNRDVWSIYEEVRVPLRARRGTSGVSIALKLTLPSASSGSARILLRC